MEDCLGPPISFEQVWKSAPQQFPAPQFLTVDDTKRSRASSDPCGLHICIVPEITITSEDGRNRDCTEDDEHDSFLQPPQQRPRANTCPEEMFRARKGRPPTPPPEDVHKSRSPAGKRFSFNFSPKDINGISFAQHRLSKVSEETVEQRQKKIQARKFSLQAQTTTHFRSSDFPQGKANGDNKTENDLPWLNSSRIETTSLTEDCSDPGNLTETVSRNSENNHNSEKHIPCRDDDPDVITLSSGKCRSTTDGRGKMDSDHLIAY